MVFYGFNDFILQNAKSISTIIEKNFKGTGLFNPLKKEAFVQKPDIAHLKPRFEDWRLIKAQALVTGKLLIKDGKLNIFKILQLAFPLYNKKWKNIIIQNINTSITFV